MPEDTDVTDILTRSHESSLIKLPTTVGNVLTPGDNVSVVVGKVSCVVSVDCQYVS
jgi:hypothetical protein